MVAAIVMHDLIRQVGDRRARDLLLSGRLIDAAEAERWGLVNRVVPAESLLGEALALGRSLVESGPLAIETTKRLLDEASGRPADPRGSAAITAAVRVSDEAREGIRAFFEKRPALGRADRRGEGTIRSSRPHPSGRRRLRPDADGRSDRPTRHPARPGRFRTVPHGGCHGPAR